MAAGGFAAAKRRLDRPVRLAAPAWMSRAGDLVVAAVVLALLEWRVFLLCAVGSGLPIVLVGRWLIIHDWYPILRSLRSPWLPSMLSLAVTGGGLLLALDRVHAHAGGTRPTAGVLRRWLTLCFVMAVILGTIGVVAATMVEAVAYLPDPSFILVLAPVAILAVATLTLLAPAYAVIDGDGPLRALGRSLHATRSRAFELGLALVLVVALQSLLLPMAFAPIVLAEYSGVAGLGTSWLITLALLPVPWALTVSLAYVACRRLEPATGRPA